MNDSNRFYCFDKFQRALFVRHRDPIARITNRCFTNWEPTQKSQVREKRRAMTEAESQAVRNLTGFDCFLKEKYV